jgi:hypothetical protein
MSYCIVQAAESRLEIQEIGDDGGDDGGLGPATNQLRIDNDDYVSNIDGTRRESRGKEDE